MCRRFILCVLIAAGIVGCDGKLDTYFASGVSQAEAPSKIDSPADSVVEKTEQRSNEAVDRPVLVTGAYLFCGSILDANEVAPVSIMGCKYVSPHPLSSYALNFSLTASRLPGLTFTKRVLTDAQRKYDVIFEFTASSKEVSIQASRESIISLNVTDIVSGLIVSTLTQRILDVLKPEALTRDLLQTPYPGSALFYFVDLQTGLLWSFDDGASFTFAQAKSHCESFISPDNASWRLPTIVELQALHGASPSAVANFNISSQRFGGYWSDSLGRSVTSVWRMNFACNDLSLAANLIDSNASQSAICVHASN